MVFSPFAKSLVGSCLQLISSITEGVSTAESSTEEPMQTDEAPSAEPAPAEEAAAVAAPAMETQAEVRNYQPKRLRVCRCKYNVCKCNVWHL